VASDGRAETLSTKDDGIVNRTALYEATAVAVFCADDFFAWLASR
jgi:hypothetical protein